MKSIDMNKKQEFLLMLKDPLIWGIHKAFVDVKRIYPFVDYTEINELIDADELVTAEAWKAHGVDNHRSWHVDVGIDMDKHREWDPHKQDLDFAQFHQAIQNLLNYRIKCRVHRISDYLFDSQKIIVRFSTT